MKPRVLYVDDHSGGAELFREVIEQNGYAVDLSGRGRDGIAMHIASPYDIVAVEHKLPDITGIDVARQILEITPDVPVILVTGSGSEAIAADAINAGVKHYVIKTDNSSYIDQILRFIKALSQCRMVLKGEERDLTMADASFEGIIIHDGSAIIDTNVRFQEMFGYTRDELVGKFPFDLLSADTRGMVKKLVADETQGFHYGTGRRKDATEFPIEVQTRYMHYQGKRVRVAACNDMTKRRIAELALKESEQRFHDLAEIGADWFWEMDAGLQFTYISPANSIEGANSPENIGKTLSEICQNRGNSPELDDEIQAQKAHLPYSKIERPSVLEPERWVSSSAIPTFDGDRQFTGFRGTTLDITNRKNAEFELKNSEEQLRQITDNLPVLITYIDNTRRFRFVNSTATSWYNLSAAEIIDHTVDGIFGESSFDTFSDRIEQVLGGQMVKFEDYISYPDGNARNVQVSYLPHFGDDKKVLGYFVLAVDTTSITNADAELRANQRMMMNLLEATQEGFWQIDNDGITVKVNQAMCNIIGLPESQVIGKSLFEFVDDDNARIFEDQMKIRNAGSKAAYQISLRRPDGTNVLCINSATAIFNDSHQKIGSVGFWTDITDLQNARLEAEKSNRAKSEFLSSMSHELRTPLNSILGFGQLIDDVPENPLNEDQKECLSHIVKNSRHLIELIEDILDLSKIEAGKVEFHFEDISPVELIDDCITTVGVEAERRGIRFSVIGPDDDEIVVRADQTRLRQVLLNVLSNAIKYNRENGEVTVRAEHGSGEMFRISVADTGLGIAMSEQHKLFKPFSRLDAEFRGIEGTGIGLVVCKDLIERMVGDIGVDSDVGQGATFWFEVPISNNDPVETVTTGDSGPTIKADLFTDLDATVLYIEDNATNLKLMERIFKRLTGLTLISAPDAELGMVMAQEMQPDLILMDVNLPGIDGLAATKTLGKFRESEDIPVIAVSAAATERDIELGMEAGFKAYITKPIDVPELIDAIKVELGV